MAIARLALVGSVLWCSLDWGVLVRETKGTADNRGGVRWRGRLSEFGSVWSTGDGGSSGDR